MMQKLLKFGKKDDGVSPVIGTILMVAVTVVLGVTVYAVMSGFGDDSIQEPTNAAFKTQAVDTDGDGKSDKLKVTYISGPTAVPAADVLIAIKASNGTAAYVDLAAGGGQWVSPTSPAQWNPGDFIVFDPLDAGSYFVTVSILGDTVVDKSVMIDEA